MGFSQWSLMQKIISVSTLAMIALVLVLFVLYGYDATQRAEEAYVAKARAICLTAESTREEMEHKWRQGLFTVDQLREYDKQDRMDLILAAVPVVTAWRAAELKAEEGGYTFRVPKFSPRNPANQPDEKEAPILKKMKEEGLKEYYVIDKDINSIRYFRAVYLSEGCMLCHGDPATSVKLWGNDKGLDPTGAKMENWKVGSMHGAFQITQKLHEAQAQVRGGLYSAGFISLLCIAIAAGAMGTVILYSITRPIERMVQELNDGADQVAGASGEISNASIALAEGATSQAASLEETSSALEEIAGMTRQNAEHAKNSNEMMKTTNGNVRTGAEQVGEMSSSMDEIDKSSEEIGKIIKVIEEIAFQTNLLALNAAVEAARAGDAGKGFAVVADEVRNLAQRSAEAARNTATMINETVERVSRGGEIVKRLEKSFAEVEESAGKVVNLVEEINTASQEQAQGVDQVNNAVAQLDKVTQQNAATSEESASASEELSAQSHMLKQTVKQLLDLVKGGGAG